MKSGSIMIKMYLKMMDIRNYLYDDREIRSEEFKKKMNELRPGFSDSTRTVDMFLANLPVLLKEIYEDLDNLKKESWNIIYDI